MAGEIGLRVVNVAGCHVLVPPAATLQNFPGMVTPAAPDPQIAAARLTQMNAGGQGWGPDSGSPALAGLVTGAVTTFGGLSDVFANTAAHPATAALATTEHRLWPFLLIPFFVPPAIHAVAAGTRKFGHWMSRLWNRHPGATPTVAETQVAVADEPATAAGLSVWNGLNQVTGELERRLGGLRNAVTYCTVPFTLSESPALTLAALALAVYNSTTKFGVGNGLRDRERDGGLSLTPAGRRRQTARALGVLAPELPARLPACDVLGQEDFLPYANGVRPRWTRWASARTLGLTARILPTAIGRHIREEGWQRTRQGVAATLQGVHASMGPGYLEDVPYLLRDWSQRVAEVNGITVRFVNTDQVAALPEDSLVMYAGFNHASIWPDFLVWASEGLGHVRPVADEKNFWGNGIAKFVGLSAFLDFIGLGFVNRQTKQITAALKENMVGHGIRPLYYLNGGRVPRAYRQDGSLDETGMYSNALEAEAAPKRYFGFGIAHNAVDLATETGRTVFIPIVRIRGTHQVMPKVKKNPPWFQPHQTGQEVTFEVVRIIEVTGSTDVEWLKQEVVRVAEQTSGIRALLKDRVAEWGRNVFLNSLPGAAGIFEARAAQDVRWAILADRIRCIPPGDKKRYYYQRQLFRLLREEGDDPELNNLLVAVSKHVRRIEYQG